MKRLVTFALLVALAASAPTSNDTNDTKQDTKDDILVIDDDFFPDELKIFTAEHDIKSLVYPLNALNFDEDEEGEEEKKFIFFVEAEENSYKGISVYKNGNVTKLLASGTSIAADFDNSKLVFFGATDGLYVYNVTLNKAEKYGQITDSIIDLAKANGTDVIYILTDKNELYKVTEEGSKKEKVNVVGARQIVLDDQNNLYYYGDDKKPYVVSVYTGEVTAITGLPSEIESLKLVRPPFIIEEGVPAVIDGKAIVLQANGTTWDTEVEFKTKPSAYAIEGTLIQYYARGKAIYEYNILELIVGDLVESLKEFFEGKDDQIQQLATRSRADF